MSRLARRTAIAVVLLLTTACFSYHGPRGVEDSLERSIGGLKRDVGIKLGPISTRIVASLAGDHGDTDFDLHGVTTVGFVVYKRVPVQGAVAHRLDPKDLGLSGYSTLVSSSDGDDQVLILGKARGESIHEMVVLSVEPEEVVVARVTGHLDKLLAKTMDEAKAGGAHGAMSVVARSTPRSGS